MLLGCKSFLDTTALLHTEHFVCGSIDSDLLINKGKVVDLVHDFLVACATNENAAAGCLAADISGIVHFGTNDRELRLDIADDSTHDCASVHTDLDAGAATILKRDLRDEGLSLDRKLNHANRVITGQKSWVEILLTELETTTGNESLSNSVDHLKTILFAETIKAIIHFLKELGEVSAMILSDQKVKFIDFSPKHSCIAFLVGHDFLAILQAISDD